MNDKTRSPIKDKPLRTAGQSLREERNRLLEDRFEPWLMLAGFFLALAVFEWFRYFLKLPPMPVLFSALAVGAAAFTFWRYLKLRPQVRRLRQGLEGELAVGQFLERLREQGYQVFHDVIAEGFNIDHVLIGPGGVFTIETKTWSKPIKGDARIRYDGERLTVNGREPERDVRAQALGQARWLASTLEASTGRSLAVQAVVVFPGWFVEAAPGTQREVWFMEPKGLPAFLARQQILPPPEAMKLAAFHLSRYIRARERELATSAS